MKSTQPSIEELNSIAIKLARKIGELCKRKKHTIVVAESATGGLIQHLLTEIPGSSTYFLGGVIAYANKLKQHLLNVPPSIIEKYGAVSEETVTAMAQGVQKNLKGDIGLATSGIAGPTGARPNKPIGLVYVAVASSSEKTITHQYHFTGARTENKLQFAIAAFRLLLNTSSG